MSENELVKNLNNLKLTDTGIDVANGDKYDEEQKKQLRINLQDTKDNNFQTLSQQLVDNPTQVLLFLQLLNDKSGTILVKLIKHGNESYKSVVMSILSAIRGILIKSSRLKTYYLKVYISVITQFKITNAQHLNLLLTFIGGNKEINNAVLVILVQDLDLSKQETVDIVKEYLQLQSDEQTLNDADLQNFMVTLEVCFPILPQICSTIYANASTKQHIQNAFSNQGERNVSMVPVLKCIAASSVLDNCRSFTIRHYYSQLSNLLSSSQVRIRILSALSVAKLWTFLQAEQKSKLKVTNLAKDLLLYVTEGDDFEYIEYSLEGLVYLSLFWQVRDMIRMDVSFVEKLIEILHTCSTKESINTSVQFGILSLLSNITELKQPDSQSTAKKLKNVSAPQMGSNSNEENQDNVKLFNKQLVEQYEIISKLSAIKTYQSSSKNNFNQILSIIFNLSTDQAKSVRVALVKQGALVLIMNFLVSNSTIEKTGHRVVAVPSNIGGGETLDQRFKALRSLARLLICVDPQTSFQKYDVKSAVPFLVELLGPVASDPFNTKQSYLHEVTLLDGYESLLALTNIAATENSETRKLLVSQIAPYIDELIVSKDHIQIASFELLNNLISEPILLAKFFNIEQLANKQRLEIVVKLLDSDNLRLQAVIAGFLVNATNFDVIADVLVESKPFFNKLLETIISIIREQVSQDDLINPISFLLVNLVYALANKDESQLTSLKSDELKSACLLVLKNGSSESKEAVASVWSLVDF
ncbi:SHE4 [Candida theae]|uniref:SHE4 n=1 Tax=Candida theae TaxID=1198502 RepID=A0AAD5BDQ6_9ASCO|nr:SHE4 [Candida theae]KAI5957659.1 SHE4 [Candida theae]